MTDKELRRLSRAELLQMLLDKTREADQLRKELEQTKAQLESREIRIQDAGSLAEASLKLSGVFEAAQQAADLYLENVGRQYAIPKEPAP